MAFDLKICCYFVFLNVHEVFACSFATQLDRLDFLLLGVVEQLHARIGHLCQDPLHRRLLEIVLPATIPRMETISYKNFIQIIILFNLV